MSGSSGALTHPQIIRGMGGREMHPRPFVITELAGAVMTSEANPIEPHPNGPSDTRIIQESTQRIREWRNLGFICAALHHDARVAEGKPLTWAVGIIEKLVSLMIANPFIRIDMNYHVESSDHPYWGRPSTTQPPRYGMLAKLEDHAATKGVLVDWDASYFIYYSDAFKLMFESLGVTPIHAYDAYELAPPPQPWEARSRPSRFKAQEAPASKRSQAPDGRDATNDDEPN